MDTTCCSVVALDETFTYFLIKILRFKNMTLFFTSPLRPCLLWMDSRSSPQTQAILEKARGDHSLFVNNDGEGPISAEWMIPKVKFCQEI